MLRGMESSGNGHTLSRGVKIALLILGAILIILIVLLIRNYLSLRRANIISRRELSLSAFVHKHGPLNADEVGVIRPWMTFDYVNRIFNLPQDYLKDQLQISDPRYPDLTLGAYASASGTDSTETVLRVEHAIVDYAKQPAL